MPYDASLNYTWFALYASSTDHSPARPYIDTMQTFMPVLQTHRAAAHW
jgi:hypothetical protein